MSIKSKNLNKSKAAESRVIETSLVNKEEVFKMLALAEATGMPLLLEGNPGVGKTKTVIEYAKAWLMRDKTVSPEQAQKDFMNKLFILETDEGTKSSEVKGIPNMEKLFTENKYEVCAPIAEAEIVVINEVDKASSNIRNSLLGVMNEKFVFNGKEKIPCKWKLFIATCNEIPKEEEGSPFWDRFILKMKVGRVTNGELIKYFDKGGRDYREKFTIGIPNKEEMNALTIPTSKLEKFLEVGYSSLSDRTLTFVPTLAKAVSFIWNTSLDKSLVKVAGIMIGNSAPSELQNKLYSPEVKALMTRIELLTTLNTTDALDKHMIEIEGLITGYASTGRLDESQVDELEASVQYILDTHPVKQNEAEMEDILEDILSADTGTTPAF